MANEVLDGSGKGYRAKVDSTQRLWTNAVEKSVANQASIDGRSYNVNTGVITLTSANKSAVLYYKNNESDDIVIENLFYLIGNSTGGSGDMIISVLRNPSAGTIISNAVAPEININRNFGSSKILDIVTYKGAEADTFTDGSKAIESIVNQSASRIAITAGNLILQKGNSIGIEITPGTGNTSLQVEFALGLYLEKA